MVQWRLCPPPNRKGEISDGVTVQPAAIIPRHHRSPFARASCETIPCHQDLTSLFALEHESNAELQMLWKVLLQLHLGQGQGKCHSPEKYREPTVLMSSSNVVITYN